jgi:adenine-specific DNA methylase
MAMIFTRRAPSMTTLAINPPCAMALPEEHRPETAMTTVMNIGLIFGVIQMVTSRQLLKLTTLILAIHYSRHGKKISAMAADR